MSSEAHRLTWGGDCPVCGDRYGYEEVTPPHEPADYPGGVTYVHAVRVPEPGKRKVFGCEELDDGRIEEWEEMAWKKHNEHAADS